MNLPRHPAVSSRTVGLGFVVALHVMGLYALSAGLIKAPVRQAEPTQFKPLAPDLVDRTPPPPVRADLPKLPSPSVIQVPETTFVIESPREPASVTTVTARPDATPTGTGPTTSVRTDPPPATVAPVQTSSAGAVCSVMPRPDVPSVAWTGEAVLQAVATVRGGRVISADIRVAQGAMDSKTRRSLQRAVESALSGYHCQGDAVFQQDFAFRLD